MVASEPTTAGLIQLNGAYVNVEQLLTRLEKSEESRRESEFKFKQAQSQLGNEYLFKNASTSCKLLVHGSV